MTQGPQTLQSMYLCMYVYMCVCWVRVCACVLHYLRETETERKHLGRSDVAIRKKSVLNFVEKINSELHMTVKLTFSTTIYQHYYEHFYAWESRYHVKRVPCHEGMACPQVADPGEGLQIWRVAANSLNKQSRTAEMGWFSSLGIRQGLSSSSR
jgi:hypothetical protein